MYCSAFYKKDKLKVIDSDVLLTLHLSIFISVFNQLDAQNLFHNKFYFMPLHVSSTSAHHQEVKIALHSLWYHQTYRWTSHILCVDDSLVCSSICSCIPDGHLHRVYETSTYRFDDTRGCVMQF